MEKISAVLWEPAPATGFVNQGNGANAGLKGYVFPAQWLHALKITVQWDIKSATNAEQASVHALTEAKSTSFSS